MAAQFQTRGVYGGPGILPRSAMTPVQFANGAVAQASGAPQTPSAAPSGQRRGRPQQNWDQANNQGPWQSFQPYQNPETTPGLVPQASTTAAEDAAALAASTAATTTPAATTSWLDENTITASYTNGQVLLAGGAALALLFLLKRR